ncbi:hypothetical protein [Actinomyces culturomici]|uniref:hypothetical protein n=1 Tax=Actinomyces culturomici TaxID=1926276 RepID=UPI0013592C3C|nr:hypothetical protein [Actinomyces culturomici]
MRLFLPRRPRRHGDERRPSRATGDAAPLVDAEGAKGAVATSGYAQQTGHVTGRMGLGSRARQATVVGPDAGLADALATALLVDGREGARWFTDFANADVSAFRPVSRWGAIVIEGDELLRLGSCRPAA